MKGLSILEAHFEVNPDPAISLLHLELFNHWDKLTRPGLSFPEIWPVLLQRAFDVSLPVMTLSRSA